MALVGSTGSGKSVLAALLSRLYDVTEGEIRIDGQDIRELSLAALRQAVATAFEDPTLFSMSVAENLRLGRGPDNPASDQQLEQAIEIAAAQFVYDLPFGLDTRIGEQGMSLSGGQRQRLSLARAILAAPKILVLDDTLSALDVHTEAVVEEALGRLLHHVTGIVVAHRASTVLLADKVALLDRIDRGGDHPPYRHPRRTARRGAAVPLPAGRRRRARRRRRAGVRVAGRRRPQSAGPGLRRAGGD